MTDAGEPRFVGRSDSGTVEAEADARARIVAIRIDPVALASARAADLSAQVLEAVQRVRAQARHGDGEVNGNE